MDIVVPEVGESIREAVVGRWHREDGAQVAKDELLCELETDKVNVEIHAEASGRLSIVAAQGETVAVGATIATLEEGPEAAAAPTPAPQEEPPSPEAPLNPAARKRAAELGIDLGAVQGSGRAGRITLDDLPTAAAAPPTKVTPEPEATEKVAPAAPAEVPPKPAPAQEGAPAPPPEAAGRTTREPMSPIRKTIAQRLLAARQQTAMLTTFNEADMSRVVALRKKHREHFEKKHGVSLGYMSFFVKACVEALKEYPEVNARIDGDDIVYQHFYDIGIAVGSDRGLVVPVLRDAEHQDFAGIEQAIGDFVQKVQQRRITLAELEGGTFTITNGGVYGSLLSTPILNPPQSAVLGMHAIQERPVAREGEVVIRPMMNLALSYDHRLIDGRQAVQFLRRIKELIEDPEEMLLEL